MSCELTTYTTNVTDCCYLQILCNGTVVREFNLAELRVVDKGDSFTIRDRVGSMDFSNATIDVTAEDVRTLRCSCAGAAVECCTNIVQDFATGNYYHLGNFGNSYTMPGDEALIIAFVQLVEPDFIAVECNMLSYCDSGNNFFYAVQNQNGVLKVVMSVPFP